MEVLRLPTTTAVQVEIPGLPENDPVVVTLTNSVTLEVYDTISATTDAEGTLVFDLPAEFTTHDGYLVCDVADDTDSIWNDNIDVVRPYVNPYDVTEELKCSDTEAVYYERIARYMIDSKTGGFKFLRKVKSTTGLGNDYLPMDEKIWSIESIYENGELVWDTVGEWSEEYVVSPDHTAVVIIGDGNREEYRPVWRDRYSLPDFPQGWDYEITGQFGYRIVPQDIREATLLVMNDLACGNLKFWNKYISQYKTDAFDIKYDRFKFGDSTGNMIADMLISRYCTNLAPRVL